ncbi:response regulator [Sphingobacterium thalpophilum]|uniref:response regulator n=1 Tax=Sphingobacterium thalpophilum TaxID=259 RepID=UPI003D963095
MTEIILVDDHQVVRNGLRLLLESNGTFEVVQELGSAEETLLYLEHHQRPDLILTDLGMKEMDGTTLTKILKNIYPEMKVAVLSMIEEQAKVVEAFNAGADGYLSKGADYDELLFGISQVAAGKQYLTTAIALDFVRSYKTFTPETNRAITLQQYDISERELMVLELIAAGHTNAEIADKIFLSKRTVEGHRQHLLEKTNTKNTAGLIRFAFQNNLLQ